MQKAQTNISCIQACLCSCPKRCIIAQIATSYIYPSETQYLRTSSVPRVCTLVLFITFALIYSQLLDKMGRNRAERCCNINGWRRWEDWNGTKRWRDNRLRR